ncbi:MAG: TIGR00730 family Rossman fold protein [Oscillospiraceae bacterium]|nr:TIGR00730 family Rossman fold protein [Oscillospiraceae bacterium]
MNICVYGASSNVISPAYIEAGEALGRAMAKRGHSLVFGGGASGMMGAAARGMTEGGGKIVGVAPRFFDVDGILYQQCTEFVFTDTMRERKSIMEEKADAFIMTPGGIGTFEEFYEILTLRQLGRHNKPIAILNVGDYYRPLIDMQERAIKQKFMKPECESLCGWFDDPEALLDYLETSVTATARAEDMKYLGT